MWRNHSVTNLSKHTGPVGAEELCEDWPGVRNGDFYHSCCGWRLFPSGPHCFNWTMYRFEAFYFGFWARWKCWDGLFSLLSHRYGRLSTCTTSMTPMPKQWLQSDTGDIPQLISGCLMFNDWMKMLVFFESETWLLYLYCLDLWTMWMLGRMLIKHIQGERYNSSSLAMTKW